MPFSVNGSKENHHVVKILSQGEEQIVLAEEQDKSFYSLHYQERRGYGDAHYFKKTFSDRSRVDLKENEDGTGSPQRIIFGCLGGESSNETLVLLILIIWRGGHGRACPSTQGSVSWFGLVPPTRA